MSIQNLMTAAHAAGFAMAVSDEFLVEDEKIEIAAKVVEVDPERSIRGGAGRAHLRAEGSGGAALELGCVGRCAQVGTGSSVVAMVPSGRRAATAQRCGPRIITPSTTAWPPIGVDGSRAWAVAGSPVGFERD